MNSEDSEDCEFVDDAEECTSQRNKIVIFAIASVSDRTAAKMLKLGLTDCR
jgi:hypothetical protein